MSIDSEALMTLGMGVALGQAIGSSCGTVAAAGTTYADATPCYEICLVTDADGSAGVILPALDNGKVCIIRNVANNNLKIYTNSSDETIYVAASATAVNGQSTGITIAAYYTAILAKVSGTEWISLEVVGA